MNYVTIMLQVFKQSSCLMFKEVMAVFCGHFIPAARATDKGDSSFGNIKTAWGR